MIKAILGLLADQSATRAADIKHHLIQSHAVLGMVAILQRSGCHG
jgi:hypothetical protein